MSKNNLVKFIPIVAAVAIIGVTVQARPEYLKIYAADPFSKPELRSQCSVCHVDPAGGSERNAFGKAFLEAGLKITPALRQKFPDRFNTQQGAPSDKPPVTFTQAENEAVIEYNGKRFVINTKDKTVSELAAEAPAGTPKDRVAMSTPVAEKQAEPESIYHQYDVRLVSLPTATPIPKGSLWTDFTHRFPFGDSTDSAGLFGLDSSAIPSFGFIYGITDRIHVGGYRSPGDVGRPIQLYLGASLLSEHTGDPMSVMARVGLEGRDNFKRNFTTSLELTFARSITRHAQLYVVPTISLGDRPINSDPTVNLPAENAFALGVGAAVNIRPSVALMAEANYRLNDEARYINRFSGIRRPAIGVGLQKASISRRHTFSLTFSNSPGTTFSQRSMTRGVYGADDTFRGLTIGFNISRRLF